MNRNLLFVLAFALLASPASRAQTPFAVGEEFLVNTYTTGPQFDPSVAMDADGGFVVVWSSYGSDDGDTSYVSIQGRRFAAGGSAVGSQFQVNAYTTGLQWMPAVTVETDGDFVVVWTSSESDNGDSSGSSVQGQRFAADGSALGSQFLVNSYLPSFQALPAVATDASGDFAVVWSSYGLDNGDTSYWSVQGQRFTAGGAAVGSQFLVNTYTTFSQTYPVVAMQASGDFVVIWHSFGSDNGDPGPFASIQGQRYAADGGTAGPQFLVNSYTPFNQLHPAVAMDASGNFVVVWQSFRASPAGSDVDGRRFASDGTAVGSQFQASSSTSGSHERPKVAVDADGDFVVVWQSDGADTGDASGDSIRGRRFAADGSAVGAQFLVNSYTTNHQRWPAVATNAAGDFVVVWQSDGADNGDTSSYSVQGQRFKVTPEVGDRVWHDVNGNGVQDGGEPGVAGVIVTLHDDQGTPIEQTLTDGDGLFVFTAPKGDYYLEFTPPAGFVFTARDVGADDVDSDASADGLTIVFSLGGRDLTRDAGLITAPPTLVGDRVWLDADGDGLQSGGEVGVANVEVRLFREPDPPFLTAKAATLEATTLTDADGYYSFTVDLEAGESGLYYLEFVCVSGAFTGRDQGGDDIDSDVFPASGTTAPFALAAGDADGTRDAGLLDPDDDGVACSDCDEGDPTNACVIFTDGFESGDTLAWSSSVL